MTRIFPPPVHALISPTRVPVDLRANFRLFDEEKFVSAYYHSFFDRP